MRLAPAVRKLTLTAHVASSVGWLGAVAASLVLGIVALTSQDTELVRAVYRVLEPLGWYLLVPLSIASLLTGLVQSLGTRWGLLRHYWVVVKLVMNVFASVILLLYMQTLGDLADRAAASASDLTTLRSPSAVVHATGALVLLVVATVLSVYKPAGVTMYGQRKQRAVRAATAVDTDPTIGGIS